MTPFNEERVFTDDDLKRLKECISPQTYRLDICLFPQMSVIDAIKEDAKAESEKVYRFDLVALLARLEAAEKVIMQVSKSYEWETMGQEEGLNNLYRDFELWLKAAGK